MLRKLATFMFGLAVCLSLHAATPVNVNTADAATIAKALDGIGPAKAAAIVAWREEHGPFKSVDEVGQVKGVGASTLDRNRAAILITEESAKPESGAAKAKPKAKKDED
ncbi:helix-hairpin-helix domain-containing protein [Dyella sp. LX-66]|uniref:ComEA family DNA-binding protein n=1 Tax=unclassified Dyella TaxID=2634549 RepID=UPI001BE0B1E5|nr:MULTISPECIES: helix-hairpin-helix domain-containing protein [unclassified Dyella]MBT2118696.1 helix-hairpin-helix domain-containing protein [Dyella sp. LX-1]MBT2141045.1 helix-hairpin-helix domain-containing protein [Dyella sp. LX-66]